VARRRRRRLRPRCSPLARTANATFE